MQEKQPTKVLLVGDIHAREHSPQSVEIDYFEDLLEMLHEAALVAKREKVDATIWSGDVFDFKQPSKTGHSVVLRMIQAAREFDNLYIVVGNHDISQSGLDSLPKQPLGVLFEAGVATMLDGWNCYSREGKLLPVYGVNWQQDWLAEDTPNSAWEAWRERGDNSEALTVTHCPIYPKEKANDQMFELVPTSVLSSAMGNEGYLYYGHIHEDHGVFTEHGVTFANVGALSRGSLQEYNTTRKIQVALWDSQEGFTPVELPHKSAEEVFSLEEKAVIKAEEIELDNFFTAVGSATIARTDGESVREYILHREDIEKPVRTKAVSYIEEVG